VANARSCVVFSGEKRLCHNALPSIIVFSTDDQKEEFTRRCGVGIANCAQFERLIRRFDRGVAYCVY
jgi:hypothetical protein